MTKTEICNLSLDRLAIEPIKEDDLTKTATGYCSVCNVFDVSNLSVITATKSYVSTLYHIVFITRQDSNAVEPTSIKCHMTLTSVIGTQYL
jgi:hypothetical protein